MMIPENITNTCSYREGGNEILTILRWQQVL